MKTIFLTKFGFTTQQPDARAHSISTDTQARCSNRRSTSYKIEIRPGVSEAARQDKPPIKSEAAKVALRPIRRIPRKERR